ncbi:DUF1289 domain-containing protein [Shewanella maritima]|uniref:DUF1289 domain-containing protein n=1 Tax=Shewanella maritima TaxID=2520507 RepID=UPI003734CB5C
MEQLSFFNVPSPCVGICQTDARGYCLGCFRSRDERFGWMNLTDGQKHNVIRLCKQRKRRRQYALMKHAKTLQQQEQAKLNQQLEFEEVDDEQDNLKLDGFELD